MELPDGSYSVSYILDYIECIIKKHEILTAILPVNVFINRIDKMIVIKGGCKVELQTSETMKLIKLIEIAKNIPSLEIVLVQCNLVHNQ